MNISSISSQFTNLFSKSKASQKFIIYEIGALTAQTPKDLAKFVAIEFDSVIDYSYQNEVKIPFQPLEGGLFSTDSILTSPFILKCTGAITMSYTNDTVAQSFADISLVVALLLFYLQNSTQLVIFEKAPFFSEYSPMHLRVFNYEVSPDNNTLYANMEFQEVQSTPTVYATPVFPASTQSTNPNNYKNANSDGFTAKNGNQFNSKGELIKSGGQPSTVNPSGMSNLTNQEVQDNGQLTAFQKDSGFFDKNTL